MDKKLQEIQQQLRRENRGRLWRPRRELREAIQRWAADARGRGLTWREISTALTVDKDKLKSWQQQAVRATSASDAPQINMVPVCIAEPNTSKTTLVILRGASMAEIAALLEQL